MRVTNSMITHNTLNNINGNKSNVDRMNNQMSTQKKISRASEDPVIAIRSLRLRTTLSEINQFYNKNIPDAESWLESTESALENMKSLMGQMYQQSVYGTNDPLTQDDRNAILKNITELKNQVYSELNADEAGRTVFSGYKTNRSVTYMSDDPDAKFQLTEKLSFDDITEKNYYAKQVKLPTSKSEVNNVANIPNADNGMMLQETTQKRLRLTYDQTAAGTNRMDSFVYRYTDASGSDYRVTFADPQSADADGVIAYGTKKIEKQNPDGTWAAAGNSTFTFKDMSYSTWQNKKDYEVDPNDIVYIPESGEVILGENVVREFQDQKVEIDATYTKSGFEAGDVRPEMYFDCVDQTSRNSEDWLVYTKEDQQIGYTIAYNQVLNINTQADEVIDAGVARDVDEMIEAVQLAIDANDKLTKLKAMKSEAQYADKESQANLAAWITAAEKETAYANDNMKKMFSKQITKFDDAQKKIILAETGVGERGNRLALTKVRVEAQQTTYEDLKASNEDREISDIIIDFTAAYNAYQASLQAASRATQNTLLNYL